MAGCAVTCSQAPNHCADRNTFQKGLWAEFDYNHGDRCILELTNDGKIFLSPEKLTLRPAQSGAPSTAPMVITAFSEFIRSGDRDCPRDTTDGAMNGEEGGTTGGTSASDPLEPACRTIADGYQLTIELSDGCSGISLDHASNATTCFISTPTLLRCLTDATGSLVVNVASSLETPSNSECNISVSSGAATPVGATVSVKNSLSDLDLVIHSPLEAAGACGTSIDKACAVGGTPQCDGQNAAPPRPVPFYVATERDGQIAPTPSKIEVSLAQVAVTGPPATGVFTDVSCKDPQTELTIKENSGNSDTAQLCLTNLAGAYQLLAVAQSTGLGTSLFLRAEAIPWRVRLTKNGPADTTGGDGTTDSGGSTGGDTTTDGTTTDNGVATDLNEYHLEVLDASLRGIPHLEVHIISAPESPTETFYSVTTDETGRAIITTATDLLSPTVRFPTWGSAGCEPLE